MNPFVFDVNTYVQDDPLMMILADGVIQIHPLVGYEDDVSPVILYWWMPGTVSFESYYICDDFIRYHIVDTDAERGFKLQEALKARLNIGDLIQGQIASTTGRVLSSFLLRSGTGAFNAGLGAPTEREGFYQFQLNFEVKYVPLDNVTLSLSGSIDPEGDIDSLVIPGP